MKTLKFDEKLVPLILSGEKTNTWRLFDDKNLKNDDEIIFINKQLMKEFAKAKITKVKKADFNNLTDKDWYGHEKYASKKEMYKAFSDYYNQIVNKDTKIKIINFKLIT